ncbi:MAG: hypothetical protein ACI9EF_002835 [Pseudohongiellaceae bacterium]|jgi:hypothetical protein
MASAPRWCQIETTNRSRISGFVEDSATKSWRYRGVLGARHFTSRLLGVASPHLSFWRELNDAVQDRHKSVKALPFLAVHEGQHEPTH